MKDRIMAYIGLLLIGIIGWVCDRMPAAAVDTTADSQSLRRSW